MPEPVYRSRPGGFEILPAAMREAREIRPGIYVSEGLSNTYLVTTSEGRIIINTGMGFEAPVHKRNFDAIDDSPVRYILLTQGHVDHVGGVDLYLEEGTDVVTQAGNAAHQLDDDRIAAFRARRSAFAFAKPIAAALKYMKEGGGGGGLAQSKPKPTITFEENFAIQLGSERFELISVPGGETTDSLIIWMPDRKICFCGNLFSALFGHIPNLVTIRGDRYRDALKFVASLDKVLDLEPELLLVGHHGPVEGRDLIRAELERIRAATLYIHDETVKGMNEHKPLHQLQKEIQLPKDIQVGEGYGKVSWDVRAIWETYAGWFHHDSTTELYCDPRSVIHGDLIELAGGADAIAARARKHLDAGHAIQAIHLAEIVLSQERLHRPALEVCLAAHEQLDRESENFWLSSWLRKEAALIRQLLGPEES